MTCHTRTVLFQKRVAAVRKDIFIFARHVFLSFR